MNKWRIAGLVLVAILAAWFTLRGCTPDEEPRVPETAPVRDQFHASKPLAVTVTYASPQDGADPSWLERELRYLLIRGQMRIAAIDPTAPPRFSLQIELAQPLPTHAHLKLVAPDGVIERQQDVELPEKPLAAVQSLLTVLPSFLGAVHSEQEWTALIGTADEGAYEAFLRSSNELFAAQGRGFTQPLAADSSDTVDRLEALIRRQPQFARASALLAVAYLSMGGEDEASLTQLAESTAERALGLDSSLSDAQSALGLARLRRGEWAAAMEHFNAALTTDPNASAALEGLACLLIDVGHAKAAVPIAQRAALLQPGSIGANECLIYAQLAAGASPSAAAEREPLAVAQARALDAILAGEPSQARQLLRDASNTRNAATWIDPLINAASDRRQTSNALRAITRAAGDRLIDPVTEVVCGAALRQSEFVFNRLLRLHKQNDSLPLRLLWLPKTEFLRQHPRFEDVVSTEGLLPFWQDHGLPDICVTEPEIYGCKLKAQKKVMR